MAKSAALYVSIGESLLGMKKIITANKIIVVVSRISAIVTTLQGKYFQIY